MAVTEAQRHGLYESIKAAHGEAHAETFMNLYTPTDVSQLATKSDLLTLAGDLRGEMADLRGGLRGEMADLRGELERQIATVRVDIERVERRVYQAIISQTRWLVGFVVSWSAVVVAAVKLLF